MSLTLVLAEMMSLGRAETDEVTVIGRPAVSARQVYGSGSYAMATRKMKKPTTTNNHSMVTDDGATPRGARRQDEPTRRTSAETESAQGGRGRAKPGTPESGRGIPYRAISGPAGHGQPRNTPGNSPPLRGFGREAATSHVQHWRTLADVSPITSRLRSHPQGSQGQRGQANRAAQGAAANRRSTAGGKVQQQQAGPRGAWR
ncbi:hypothetical protein BaRGS_00033163 [Batillaria attramentaria]|uniref:Uncharacterized protein n=1 Tax=Batillaria attramentaria TaxID=370345 RepID=A0ABD0JLA6_9CAEN